MASSLQTPMMKQFYAIKAEHVDCILFFRAGDFYEMFGDDAIQASQILQIALTTRNKNSEDAVPMCGVPYHAYEGYLQKIIAAGLKVAMVEQMEPPTPGKSVIKREVVRIVTPGTHVSTQLLHETHNCYLLCIDLTKKNSIGAGWVDLSTGQFSFNQWAEHDTQSLLNWCAVEKPREILLSSHDDTLVEQKITFWTEQLSQLLNEELSLNVHIATLPQKDFSEQQAQSILNTQYPHLNLEHGPKTALHAGWSACGALLSYLINTQKCDLSHLSVPQQQHNAHSIEIDPSCLQHLEIFESTGAHSLYQCLDQTQTPMGARALRHLLGHPLKSAQAITNRWDAIDELIAQGLSRVQLAEALNQVKDLERIVGRLSLPQGNFRDTIGLRESLQAVTLIPPLLEKFQSSLMAGFYAQIDPAQALLEHLCTRYKAEPSLKLGEGECIADGVDAALDQARMLTTDSRRLLSEMEAAQREATGISSLKIRYNKVFGYYLEVPRNRAQQVPAHYFRKQTLSTAERYSSEALEALATQILTAQEKIVDIERALYEETLVIIKGYARRLLNTAEQLAALDVLHAFAACAVQHRYVRPSLITPDQPATLRIVQGRHPVLEQTQSEPFVPNDIILSADQTQMALITGPNMAGKSTLMRQTALIQLMAQTGCFVPAEEVAISLVDGIFTRVGASDNLLKGQSTFMVEMLEAAKIIHHAGPKSLIVLDEIGRGTSTYDGISIAWAIIEYLHQKGPLTLCATHYHELTQLSKIMPHLHNFSLPIYEEGEQLIFTRTLKRGKADRSYGIEVAKLAGLPNEVIERAHQVLDFLTQGAENKENPLAKMPTASTYQVELPLNKGQLTDSAVTTNMNNDSLQSEKFTQSSRSVGERGVSVGNRGAQNEVDCDIITSKQQTLINCLTNLDLNQITPVNALIKLQDFQNHWKQNIVQQDEGEDEL